jgi:hypothetical protein
MTVLTPDTVSLASASRPSLAVYDGTIMVGRLIRHADSFEAVDINDVSYGVFTDMRSAAFALPTPGGHHE